MEVEIEMGLVGLVWVHMGTRRGASCSYSRHLHNYRSAAGLPRPCYEVPMHQRSARIWPVVTKWLQLGCHSRLSLAPVSKHAAHLNQRPRLALALSSFSLQLTSGPVCRSTDLSTTARYGR